MATYEASTLLIWKHWTHHDFTSLVEPNYEPQNPARALVTHISHYVNKPRIITVTRRLIFLQCDSVVCIHVLLIHCAYTVCGHDVSRVRCACECSFSHHRASFVHTTPIAHHTAADRAALTVSAVGLLHHSYIRSTSMRQGEQEQSF